MRKKIRHIVCLLQAAVLVMASPCAEVLGEGLLSEEVILEEAEVPVLLEEESRDEGTGAAIPDALENTEAFSNDPAYGDLIIEDGLIEDADGEEPELEQDGFQRPEAAGDMQETELTGQEETETQEEENLDQSLGNEEGLLSDASETGAGMEGEAGEGEEDEIIKVITDTEIYINPEYAGIIRESDLNHPAAVDIPSVGKVQYAASIEAAGADMRSQLKKRQETITIHYKISRDEYYGSLVWDILDAAVAHTGVPTEGDYLRPQYGGIVVGMKYQISKRFYYCDFTYTMTYFTNAAQEAAVDSRIAQVMASLNLAGKSEYGKIKAIYDYICGNVKYDHEHGEDYKLRYTAYAALIDGSAVCNGYAVLFYRMALEAGLSTRYVSGYTASDGSGSHAWNIVRINGLYYNLDSTWDAGSKNYKWFLRSPADFTSHYRAERYIAANFNGQYPMSSQNYSLEGAMQAETSGKCGTNLTWSLDQNGVLKIQGAGKMTDYSDAQPAPWNGRDVRKVILSSGVSSVGSHAFCYLENLTSATLPASVKSIGSFAFTNCKSLSAASFPAGLTAIGESAFTGCTGLSALSIPGGVKSIGANAFRKASGLRSVTLADGVAGIGQMAFAECSSLESLTFPISAAKGDSSVFGSCWKLTKVEITGTGAIPDYASDKSAPWNRPTVQSVKIRSGITGIGSYAFYQLDSLKSISLPSSVKKIGKEAFAYCDGLTGISIPSSVTAIGESAFTGCTGLSALSIPGGVKSIGANAFRKASGLRSVTLADGVAGIGQMAFAECSSLESLTIPVRISGKNTIFSGCGKLTKVDIIGTGAMPECVYAWDRPWWQPSIKTVVIHSGVTSIGRAAFYNLDHLTSVTIPSSVKKIGKEAFAFCDQLTRITIPNGVTEIGEGAFCKCVKLASVSLPSSVKSIGVKAFAWCDSLKSVKLSEKLEKISESSFYLCKNLTSITIPSKVKTIGKEAFAFCYNLTNADIPTSVTSIGSKVFVSCTKLKITGYTGSTAYNYAVKNKIPFKSKGFVTPVMKKAESAKDGIKVSWNKVSGAKSYRVYRKNGNGWTIIGDVKSGNTTSYTDKKAKAGTLYTYKVRVCSNGKPVSDYSANSVTGVRMTAPVLSEAKNVTGRKIRVKWKKCAGASGYEIRYTTGSNVKTIKVTKGTTVEKVISGLKKNKTYTVKVRSYKTSGKNTWYSSWSGQKKVVVRK